jgi:arylsulfatase A-like enzyme
MRKGLARGGAVLGLAAAGLLGLHAYNYARMDASALNANAAPLLERARALSERARPEYQELALATLPPNPLNGPAVRLDEMLDRAVATERPDPAGGGGDGGGVVYALEFDDPASPGLAPARGSPPAELRDGTLRTRSGAPREAYLATPNTLAIPTTDVGNILIRARADKGSYMQLAWAGEAGPEDGRIWRHRLDVHFVNNEGFHVYVINAQGLFKQGLRPGEKLSQLFLQASDVAGAEVEIDYIRFVSKNSQFLRAENGAEYQSLGAELRRAVYMRPDQRLEFSLKVPERDPRLEFGTGVLLDGRPLRFEVTIAPAAATPADAAAPQVPVSPAVLHDALVPDSAGWRDARVDLRPWAGREVRLGLRVSGEPTNVGFWSSPRVTSARSRPFNVIMLVEDAMRADYLSVYGHPRRTTPFKEELMAQRGVLFEHAVTQAEKTRPSGASYMTSLYPTATGVWALSDVLSERHLTLAEVMRAQGFATASIIQNSNVGTFAGLHQGFDRLLELVGPRRPAEEVLTGEATRRWLEDHKDRNFFLYLHVVDPHAPYDPPSPYREKYLAAVPKEGGVPVARNPVFDPDWVERPTVEDRRARYEGEIEHNDAQIRAFFEQLDRTGLAEDTLVVMTSDHGEHLGERGLFGNRMWDHRPPTNLWATHVPLMMVYPARFKEPKRLDAPVQSIDIMPTVLELAGVDRSDLLLQGESLVGLVEGERPDYWQDRVVVAEEPTAMRKDDPCACGSVYFRDWHVLSSTHVWPRKRIYLPHLQAFLPTSVYAVEKGRGEALAASFVPDLLTRLRQRSILAGLRDANMATWRKVTAGDTGSRVIDPETIEQLRGLGYVN